MKYGNGEPITKDRMEDEPWYPDYQAMLEQALDEPALDDLILLFNWDYEDIFGSPYPNQEQAGRWAEAIVSTYET